MKINHSLFSGCTLVGVGLLRTLQDYKNDTPERKNKNLIRNIVITSACTAGMISADKFLSSKITSKKLQDVSLKFSKKIIDNPFVDSIVKKLMPKRNIKPLKSIFLADVIEDCSKDVLMTTSGFMAGIISGQILDNTILRSLKNDNQKNIDEIHKKSTKIIDYEHNSAKLLNNKITNKILNEKSKNALMSTAKMLNDVGYIDDPFERPTIIMDSYELSKSKNIKQVAEQTTLGIISEAIWPAFFCSLTNSILKEKSWKFKLPALVSVFFFANYISNKTGKTLNKE